MKIVQIGSYPLNTACIKGGVEASVYGLTIEQAKTNQLIVIDIPRTEIRNDYTEKQSEIIIFRFSNNGKSNFSALSRLRVILRTIKEQQPDICHIHTTSLFAFLLYLVLKFKGIPTFVTVHGLAHIEKRNTWKNRRSIRNGIKYFSQSVIEFIFLSICPIFIVDTQYVADTIKQYKRQGKIIRMPICKVIPQGVNDIFFKLDNATNNHQLLAVGAICKRKGHLFLIDIFEKVRVQFPGIILNIVGSLSEPAYLKKIQTSIAEKNFEDVINVFPDSSFDEVLKLYRNAAVFLLHSEEESQGIVFCEAMAAGKPIVATNVGGIPWVVENKINGLLSDFGDVDTFSQNLIYLLGNDFEREKMIENNKTLSHKYNWSHIAHEMMCLYKFYL